MATKKDLPIDGKQIDEWLKEGHKPEDVQALLQKITKAVLERALQGEMTEHLGYAKNEAAGKNRGNSRNGGTARTLKGDFGEIELETPRGLRARANDPADKRKTQTHAAE